ncbi:kinesin-like protein KIN-10C isoform X2 [Coffea arabica]|uniref:Kinesin-like protein KIN-10C isoform X2 n=1 Tax=Coffea arabica TaxID=13443 RepID=A0A6P6W855_COFAR|nr:kinesin-like protein KIN-10C isoform X2 [Coffea arabica]
MTSSTPGPDQNLKVKMGVNPSRRPVRVIGRIRGFTCQESESFSHDSPKPWITVSKPEHHGASSETTLTLSFLDQFNNSQKEASYKLDYCYEQDEDTGTLFAREIEPLTSDVLNGGHASIIAYGARGSGKTYTIQGAENKPGIAVMTMTELLSKAEETGKSVSISIFEVQQEHAYDLLDPKHSEVQVLEDCRGKINLKGLSKVPVKSILEFQNIYFSMSNISKSAHKIPHEHTRRSHKCLIIHVLAMNDNSTPKLVGKMNFVDLAGYEDSRRISRDGSALLDRTNKSLHTLLNVVYALNANEMHVPYRESKLTHIFKESLRGTGHVVLLTCLNPHVCQDTLRTLSLASRSCQSTNHVLTESLNNAKSSARFKMLSSQNSMKPFCTPSARQPAVSSLHLSAKGTSCVSKGRKLFEEGKNITSNQTRLPQDDCSDKKLEFVPEIAAAVSPSMLKKVSQEKSIPESVAVSPSKLKKALQVESILDNPSAFVPDGLVFQEKSNPEFSLDPELKENDISAHKRSKNLELIPAVVCEKSPLQDGSVIRKETLNEHGSPPLSERLRQLSNSLKSFCSSTPLHVKMLDNGDAQHNVIEPKTPIFEYGARVTERSEITKYSSPWELLSKRSSGMKDSLVQEYLRFLNSASKEELKGLRGIGEKRATYILQLREESPEPFKSLDDLQDIGLSAKQVKGMMKKMAGDLFS